MSKVGLVLKYIDWGDVELIVGLIKNSSSFCYRLLVVVCIIFFFAELQFYLLVCSSSITVDPSNGNMIFT